MSSFTGMQKKGTTSFGDNFIKKAMSALQSFAKTSPFEKTSSRRNEKLNTRKHKDRKLSKVITNNRKSTYDDSSSSSSDDEDDLRRRLIVQQTNKRPSNEYRKSTNDVSSSTSSDDDDDLRKRLIVQRQGTIKRPSNEYRKPIKDDLRQQLIFQRTIKRPSNEFRKPTNDASNFTSSDDDDLRQQLVVQRTNKQPSNEYRKTLNVNDVFSSTSSDDDNLKQRLTVQQTVKQPSNEYRKSTNNDLRLQLIIHQTNKRPSNEYRKSTNVNDYLRPQSKVQQTIKRQSKKSKQSNLSQRTPLLQSRKYQKTASGRKYTYTDKANLLDSDSTSSSSSDQRSKIKKPSPCQIVVPRLSSTTNSIKTSHGKKNHVKESETGDSESSSDSSDETQQHNTPHGSKLLHTQMSNFSSKEVALRKQSKIDFVNSLHSAPVENLEYCLSEKDPLEIVSNEVTENLSPPLPNEQNSSRDYDNLYYQYENLFREHTEINNFFKNEDEEFYGQIQDIDIDEEFGVSLKQEENCRQSNSPVPKHDIVRNIMHPDPSPSSSWASGQSLTSTERKIRQEKHGIFVDEDSREIILKPTMDIDMFFPENSEVEPDDDEYSLYSEQGTRINSHENYETSPSKFKQSTALCPAVVESEVESSYSTESQSMAEDDRDFEEEMHEIGLNLNTSLPSNASNKNKRQRKNSIKKSTAKKKIMKSDVSIKCVRTPIAPNEIDSDTESAKLLKDSLEAFLNSTSTTPVPAMPTYKTFHSKYSSKTKTKQMSQKQSTYCSSSSKSSNVKHSEKVTFRNSKISEDASKQNKVNMHKLQSSSSDSDSSDSEIPASRLPHQVAISKQNVNIPRKQLDSLSSYLDTGLQVPCNSRRNSYKKQQPILPKCSSLALTISTESEKTMEISKDNRIPLSNYSPIRRKLRSSKTKDDEVPKDDLDTTTNKIESSVQPKQNFRNNTKKNLKTNIDTVAVTSNIDPLKEECMNRKLIVKVENLILPQCKTCKQLFATKNQLSQHEIKAHLDDKDVEAKDEAVLQQQIEAASDEKNGRRRRRRRVAFTFNEGVGKKVNTEEEITQEISSNKSLKSTTTTTKQQSNTIGGLEETDQPFEPVLPLMIETENVKPLKFQADTEVKAVVPIKPDLPSTPTPLNRICYWCDAKFKLKSVLYYHITTHHTMERPFKCKTCKKEFVANCYLLRHQRCLQHFTTEEEIQPVKTFKCPKCKKIVKSNRNLQLHLKTHLPKENRCTICDKLFSQKCYLKLHMSIHNGTKPFPCPNKKCDQSYMKPKNLADHIKSAHGKLV